MVQVGIVVKMLREEYDIETDSKMVNSIMNPAKDASFGVRDELVRQVTATHCNTL